MRDCITGTFGELVLNHYVYVFTKEDLESWKQSFAFANPEPDNQPLVNRILNLTWEEFYHILETKNKDENFNVYLENKKGYYTTSLYDILEDAVLTTTYIDGECEHSSYIDKEYAQIEM